MPCMTIFFQDMMLFSNSLSSLRKPTLIRGCDLSERDDYLAREDLLDLVEDTADALL
jgi:hypothetical protein